MSLELFNAVLQKALEPLLEKWEEQQGRVDMAGGQRLTNLRFVDDVLLVAGGAASLKGMLADLVEAPEKLV